MQAFWALKWTSRLLGVFKTLWDALGIIRIQWEKSMEKSMGKIHEKISQKKQWEKSMGKIVPRGARKKIFTFVRVRNS